MTETYIRYGVYEVYTNDRGEYECGSEIYEPNYPTFEDAARAGASLISTGKYDRVIIAGIEQDDYTYYGTVSEEVIPSADELWAAAAEKEAHLYSEDGWYTLAGYEVYVEGGMVVRGVKERSGSLVAVYPYIAGNDGGWERENMYPCEFKAKISDGSGALL